MGIKKHGISSQVSFTFTFTILEKSCGASARHWKCHYLLIIVIIVIFVLVFILDYISMLAKISSSTWATEVGESRANSIQGNKGIMSAQRQT